MNHISPIADVTANDLSEAVRSTAMLADVTISMWGAERTDNAMMAEVKNQAGATGNVGRTIKNMLAGADGLLKETRSAYSAVRSEHYALTLPWVSDPHAERQRGPRLLPNMLFEQYMQRMSACKREAEKKLDAFIHDYPDLVETAKGNLGKLADLTYPTQDEVRAQFRAAFDFEPIPASTSFRGLPEHFLGKLSAKLASKQSRMIQSATAAMWEQVSDRVGRLRERMADPEAKFKSTTVEAVRDLVTLLPGWNVIGDARAAEVIEDIESMLNGVRAEDLRKDSRVRGSVAAEAQAVVDKLKGWGL